MSQFEEKKEQSDIFKGMTDYEIRENILRMFKKDGDPVDTTLDLVCKNQRLENLILELKHMIGSLHEHVNYHVDLDEPDTNEKLGGLVGTVLGKTNLMLSLIKIKEDMDVFVN